MEKPKKTTVTSSCWLEPDVVRVLNQSIGAKKWRQIYFCRDENNPYKNAYDKDFFCNNTTAMIYLAYLSHSEYPAGSAEIASFSKIMSGGHNDLVFSTFPV